MKYADPNPIFRATTDRPKAIISSAISNFYFILCHCVIVDSFHMAAIERDQLFVTRHAPIRLLVPQNNN
jgi:hypothetical protein